MTNEERGDAKLAVVLLLVVGALCFFMGRATACESYEECVSKANTLAEPTLSQDEVEEWQLLMTTAIVYKLDEIAKLLKPQESAPEMLAKAYARKKA